MFQRTRRRVAALGAPPLARQHVTDSRRNAVRNRTATINHAYLHAKHNAKAMARPKQEKSEARWRDYSADHYFHYYYRYGENEKGEPLADDHRNDDLLELAAVSCVL